MKTYASRKAKNIAALTRIDDTALQGSVNATAFDYPG